VDGKPGATAIGGHLAILATRGGLSMSAPIADDFPAIAANVAARAAPPGEEQSDWAIGDLEPVVHDLQSTEGIFGHLITANSSETNEVDNDAWRKVESDLISLGDRIEHSGRSPLTNVATTTKHQAALATAKAAAEEKAAPGSRADIERVATRCGGCCASWPPLTRWRGIRAWNGALFHASPGPRLPGIPSPHRSAARGSGRQTDDAMQTQIRDKMDLRYTVHGYRSSFMDWVAEVHPQRLLEAERALDHQIANQVQREPISWSNAESLLSFGSAN
jgi:hypothetical protein